MATGNKEPMLPWNATKSYFDMIADVPVTLSTLGNYITNEIQEVTGPDGNPCHALFQNLKINNAAGPEWGASQDGFMIYRESVESGDTTDTGDVYYTYWFKFQSNLVAALGTSSNTAWRVLSEWKTGGMIESGSPTWKGDYRIITHVLKNTSTGKLYWHTEGDNVANFFSESQKKVHWEVTNTTIPVPVGEWFKYEVFWHRSTGNSGRYWAAVNGQVIVDHIGWNKDTIYKLPINRIMLNNTYGGGASPEQQWTTGLEIWDGWPCGVGVSCYTPTGLSEKSNQEVFNVYPNPFTTNFTLKISDAPILKNAMLKINDVCGREVKNISINNHETTIDKGDLQSGIYFYNIINNNEKITNGKLVVQ
ncbi:MAG: T9SS type A sorting domain-containing protein [Bacteroidales bacterium]